MITREIAPERLEPISEESIRYERSMRVRYYFEDRKKSNKEVSNEQKRNR